MMISATVVNEGSTHRTLVRTAGKDQTLSIAAKEEGNGSSVNGGELLFLALATCYCNDIYREAKERGIEVTAVEVEVTGSFASKGEPAENIRYRAAIKSDASEQQVRDLMRHTDTVAEIQNTLRRGTSVLLDEIAVL